MWGLPLPWPVRRHPPEAVKRIRARRLINHPPDKQARRSPRGNRCGRMDRSAPQVVGSGMIVFYRNHPDAFADEVEERLRELVLAHRVEDTASVGPAGDGAVSDDAELPIIVQGSRRYAGRAEIVAFLDEIEAELNLGRQFQSDACYLDPDDPSRCL